MIINTNNRFLHKTNKELKVVKDLNEGELYPEDWYEYYDFTETKVTRGDRVHPLMRQMVDLGIADNLIFWGTNDCGISAHWTIDIWEYKPFHLFDLSGQRNNQAAADSWNYADDISFFEMYTTLQFRLNNIISLEENYSMGCWVKIDPGSDGYSHYEVFCSKDTYYDSVNPQGHLEVQCYLSTKNEIEYFGYGIQLYSTYGSFSGRYWYIETLNNYEFPVGWIHIFTTVEEGVISLYINGQLLDDTYDVPEGGILYYDSYVGNIWSHNIRSLWNYQYNQNGIIGESVGRVNDMRIFNSTLTPSQVTAIYNESKDRYGSSI
jgi:hypothetical protein